MHTKNPQKNGLYLNFILTVSNNQILIQQTKCYCEICFKLYYLSKSLLTKQSVKSCIVFKAYFELQYINVYLQMKRYECLTISSWIIITTLLFNRKQCTKWLPLITSNLTNVLSK